MATILWSSPRNDPVVAFNPSFDLLNLDNPAVSATDLFADASDTLTAGVSPTNSRAGGTQSF